MVVKEDMAVRYIDGVPVFDSGDISGLTFLEKVYREMPQDVRRIMGHDASESDMIKPIIPAQFGIYDSLVKRGIVEKQAARVALKFPDITLFDDDEFNAWSDFHGRVGGGENPVFVLMDLAREYKDYSGNPDYERRLRSFEEVVKSINSKPNLSLTS